MDKRGQLYANTLWEENKIEGLIAPCGTCKSENTHFHLGYGCCCQAVYLSLVCGDCGNVQRFYDSEK